jgi:hypothetical protein
MRINKSFLMAVGILAGAVYVFADSDPPVPFPSGYRKWAVTRSLVAGPENRNAGFHHYYANPNALEGFATGKFPDGSVIVDERLEIEKRGSDSLEGKRVSVAVMMKDGGRYAETGGWGFDIVAGDGETLGAPAAVRTGCYSCHSKQKDHDFVFSALRK